MSRRAGVQRGPAAGGPDRAWGGLTRARRSPWPAAAAVLAAAVAALAAAGIAAGAAAGTKPAARADAAVVASESSARKSLDVTAYTDDLALVRETRTVELPPGVASLEFRDVPAQIEPRSLLVSAGKGATFRLLEQNYEYDLLSRDKILEKYVGRPVAWIQEDGKRVEGRLLGMAAGPVFEVGGEIVFEVPGRIALPSLPANLRAQPTLVWLVDGGKGGRTDVEASYLTRGVSWSTDYVLELDAKGTTAGLQAWVSLDNHSGSAFENARLLLVAGQINRAAQPQPRPERMLMAAAKAAYAEGVTEQPLYDYHLYTLPGTSTLKDAQTKQVSLFGADGVAVQRHYRLLSVPAYFQAGAKGRKTEDQVRVFYTFANRRDNNLGLPMPAGVFRVYGQAPAGGRQLLGEDRIEHTPEGETIELEVGAAFDIKAERTQTDFQRVADNVSESAFRVTLRNHKTEDVTVEVVERVGGDWRVLESSLPAVKKSATELQFSVPVPAGGQTDLTYRVRVSY